MKTLKTKNIISTVLITLFLSSCSTFTITKESLVQQLNENQNISKTSNPISLGTEYYSNNLQKIKCTDKDGKEVHLFTAKNMNFIITKTSTGKTLNLYFDTVYFKNDTLFGLKSRILGGKRNIPINDVSKIMIQSETKRFDNITVGIKE
jgi:hypothetical protein